LLGSSPDEALQQLAQIPEPWPASAHYLKALAHEAKTQHDFASAAFVRALELDPAFTEARRAYAAMLIRTGRTSEGLAEVRVAIERDNKDLLAPLLLAACASQAQLQREALAALRAWYAANPSEGISAPAEYLLALAALESDANAAKASSQQARTARLRSIEASLGLVRVAAAQGNRRFASLLLNKLAGATKDQGALVQIAELALSIDDVANAGVALDQLPLTQPTSDVVILRGKHALAVKRPAEAVKSFEQALAMVAPQDPAARNAITLHLASAQAANEQRPRAIETLKGLLQRAPDDRAAIVLLSHLELVSEQARQGVQRLAADLCHNR
jgi:lipopolysaccharide biosynthesis regulator YciM